MVTILLPNFNTPVTFLRERINSILKQQYTDWECIVIDGFSTNGSWETILKLTAGDPRFHYYQKPAKGIYDAWNEGLKLAKGEYIYIATSDDLCTPDFLKEMVPALAMNPDCDLAHCCLNIIDESGNLTASQWRDWHKVTFYGDLINVYHKRFAPYDAVVHFGWSTVYTSTVQLLIRKTLFNKTGHFSTNYGTVADYRWGLSASLTANLIHIPLYLASWRRHKDQASQEAYLNSPDFYTDLFRMVYELEKMPEFKHRMRELNVKTLYFNYMLEQFNLAVKFKKIKYLAEHVKRRPGLVTRVILYRLFKIKSDAAVFIRKNLEKRGLQDAIAQLGPDFR